ncbi:hypothetical protein LJC23_05325 [Desulfovibrio sp. OttesenSCG-928-I05]|nr:hypothetical protein [Desulfovibrio sp. OttesenSCG-928-I05]
MALSSFPLWIEDRLVDDGRFAAAYDTLSDQQRGACKLAIARLETVYGGMLPGRDLRHIEANGVAHIMRREPVPWALFLLGQGFASPARLLAALMPAVLAGVPNILVCRVRGGVTPAPLPPALLAALELSGQELVADLTPRDARKLVEHACEHMTKGRVFFLGSFLGCDNLLLAASRAGHLCRAEFDPPRIAVSPAALPFYGEEADATPDGAFWPSFGYIHFAHPDAEIMTLEPDIIPGAEEYSCVLCGEEEVEAWLLSAPLALTPGEEACWIWPDFSPAFFMETRRALV